jgi:DNA-binding SARP family transcriptional activator
MRVEVLGPIRAVGPDGVVPLGGPQQRLVLGLLVAARGATLTTDRLMDCLWRDELPQRARKTIQVHISCLRRALGCEAIETSDGGYRLAKGVATDLAELDVLTGHGLSYLDVDPTVAARSLASAVRLWRGPAFGSAHDAEALQGTIARLAETRLRCVEGLLEARLCFGLVAEVLAELESLISAHPYREGLRRLHILALYRTGRHVDALRSYRTYRTMLVEDMGLEPSISLRALEQRILEQDPSLTSARPPAQPADA